MWIHLGILLAVACIAVRPERTLRTLTLTSPVVPADQELAIAQAFEVQASAPPEVGAESHEDQLVALSMAPSIADISHIVPEHLPVMEHAPLRWEEALTMDTGLALHKNLRVRGGAGVGTRGASGALDRLTQEILLSLEERPTLVVWLFDQSASLTRQRAEIRQRFQRIYDELAAVGVGQKRSVSSDPRLLSAIVAFGKDVSLIVDKPTGDVPMLQSRLGELDRDDSGVENVFRAVGEAANHYRSYRMKGGRSQRNVMLVVFTDEAGDDLPLLEPCLNICRRWAMPVYVVGVPAPLGRRQSEIKWIDPDPDYDQTPRWGLVDQGPESLLVERLPLQLPDPGGDDPQIDSGFGPYGLTRLCFETGGIYFAVHPNRDVERDVERHETVAFSSGLQRFFDETVMRPYRPEYLSAADYQRHVQQLKSRQALVQAGAMEPLTSLQAPARRFTAPDEPTLARQLTEAQKSAAILQAPLRAVGEMLQVGESDRELETLPRWQAGYDLAMGRALAARVRTEGYNGMLAQAKMGMKFQDPANNTWVLQPAPEVTLNSSLQNQSRRAQEYLRRVVEQHPQTPWAYLALRELRVPLGWRWEESHTDLAPQPADAGANNPNPAPPQDDQRRMLERARPQRDLPKL